MSYDIIGDIHGHADPLTAINRRTEVTQKKEPSQKPSTPKSLTDWEKPMNESAPSGTFFIMGLPANPTKQVSKKDKSTKQAKGGFSST